MNQHVKFSRDAAREAGLTQCPVCSGLSLRSTPAAICQFFQVRCRIPQETKITSNFCVDCNHVFFDPQPTQAQLFRYYEGYDDWFFRQERAAFEPWWSEHLGGVLDKSSPHWDIRRSVYFEAFPDRLEFVGRIVDFGGDDGSLSREIFPNSAEIVVVDIGFQGDLKAVMRRCDLLFAAHVFEHLATPFETLSRLVRDMPRSAQIWVEVPEQYQEPLPQAWQAVASGRSSASPLNLMHEHIQHFSALSIDTLLSRCGFRNIQRTRREGAIIAARARRPSFLDRLTFR